MGVVVLVGEASCKIDSLGMTHGDQHDDDEDDDDDDPLSIPRGKSQSTCAWQPLLLLPRPPPLLPPLLLLVQ